MAMATDSETLRAQLDHTLAASDLPGLGLPTTDGSRDSYDFDDFLLLVMTDRLDAGARSRGTVPFKGEVTTRMATWWLDVTGDLAPSPVERILDAQALLVRRVEPLGCRIGAWVRLSGTLWHAYELGLRTVAGITLPEGLSRDAPFDAPLVSAVDDKGAPVTTDVRRFDEARELATRLFERGRDLAAERGVALIDTIYTLGELASGELGNLDLLHAPHVTTYWRNDASLHETDIVASWRQRVDGAINLEGELPSVVLVELARAYLELGECFIADFAPTTGRAINRLSYSLSAAGLLA